MSSQKRLNLSLRLQPLEDSLLGEITEWLNSMPKQEKNNKISEALILAYLAYARGVREQTSDEEVRRCCWQNVDSLDKHRANILNYFSVDDPALNNRISSSAEMKSNPPEVEEPQEEIISTIFDDD